VVSGLRPVYHVAFNSAYINPKWIIMNDVIPELDVSHLEKIESISCHAIKLAIIGSRCFIENNKFWSVLNNFLCDKPCPTLIVSGGAVGADSLAEEWANEKRIETLIFKPQYDKFSRKEHWKANKERNTEIANYCDYLLAFWDMNSTGTRDTLEKTIDLGKPVYIYNLNSGETKLVANKEDLNE